MKNSNLTINSRIQEAEERIGDYPEKILGRGLNQPFNISNSGSRKLLSSSQSDQAVPISEPEVPIIGTGFENRYGDLSSSIIRAEGDYKVIKIIDKYSFKPKYHYFMIVYDMTNDIYKCFEICSSKHITEQYGYHYNNDYVNSLSEQDIIPKDTIIRKSKSYDNYNNRMDGLNVRCIYVGTEKNTEDSLIVTENVCRKLGTTHNKVVGFILNGNDRMLYLYGDDKTFPDIGEDIIHNIFCAIRKANKEEELYTLSVNRLKEPLMSDEKIIICKTVIDIDVKCNNVDCLEEPYNKQLKKYYNESMRVNEELVTLCQQILLENPNAKFDDALQERFFIAKRTLDGYDFINDGRKFNNIYINIMVEETVCLNIGDKLADRYGGKGVVSLVLPDELAMRTPDGEIIDIYINQSTCVNRLNPGQLFETSLTHISESIVKYILKNKLDAEEAVKIILDLFEIVSPLQYEYFKGYVEAIRHKDSYLDSFIHSIIQDQFIYLSLRPIQDNMTEDKLALIYEKFPWISQEYMDVPIVDSNGNIRRVNSRRPAIASKKYMYRLEQFSQEKFSATSLSATNIKNLNTKSKSYKKYKSRYSNTPITIGYMEADDISSVGQEFVITWLMTNSVSPKGRRLMKKALTGDPFALDIRLDEESSNRNVEMLNAYQTAKGVELIFNKVRKKVKNLVGWMKEPKYKRELVSKCTDSEEEMLKSAQRLLQAQLNNKNLVGYDLVQELSEEEYKKLKAEINNK